jgi:hypothetical protein
MKEEIILLILCLTTMGGMHISTHRLMKYAFGIGSGVMSYMPSFIKTGSNIQN